ncbi:MAG: exo-alpha-sialidase, partial [Candidatus Eremiobacteraeota bacterium]|nr:exo-alpha-sialidase [Candidatus Eremiobacteraeota bacterium]
TVAYDAVHGVWLAEVLPLVSTTGQQPVVAISKDGVAWGPKPVKVAPDNGDFIDKPWIVCDNWKTSKYKGHCYIEEDDFTAGDQEYMLTSTDGGKKWSTPFAVPGLSGEGGQPQVQPDGTVIVCDYDISTASIAAFTSTNGGKTWGNVVTVAPVMFHGQGGAGIRDAPLPSGAIDGAGKYYISWADCSFRSGCTADDIVYSTSTDGTTWSPVTRVPIDKTTSTVDHFIPGLVIDPTTSGSKAHIALDYYFLPNTNCTGSACNLMAGYISSTNGGKTWSKPLTLAGPMKVTWLANTNQGYMVGDYIATAILNHLGRPVIAAATAPKGTDLNEFTATSSAGLPAMMTPFENSSFGDRPVYRVRNPFQRLGVPPPAI